MANNNPIIRKNNKRDYNFFQKVNVSWTEFGEMQSEEGFIPDVWIQRGGNTLMLLNESETGVVEYSFNGETVHGELDPTLPTKGMTFDNRPVSYIWFRIKSGSAGPISVRIDSY